MYSIRFVHWVFCLVLLSAPVLAKDKPDVMRHIKRLKESYYDLQGAYPKHFICHLDSPQIDEALPPRLQKAWTDDSYILMTQHNGNPKLEVQNVENAQARGQFNLWLGIWKLQMAQQMKTVQERGPVALMGLFGLAMLTSEPFEERIGEDYLRFGLKPLHEGHGKMKEISIVIDRNYAIREVWMDGADGKLKVTVKNMRHEATDDRWVINELDILHQDKHGTTTRHGVRLDYDIIEGDDRNYVVYKKLEFAALDKDGKLLDDPNNKKPNPLIYEFSDYQLLKY